MATYIDIETNRILSKEEVSKRIKERATLAREKPDEFFDTYLDLRWESCFIYRNFNDEEFQNSLFQGYESYLWENLDIVNVDFAYPIADSTYEAFKQMLQYAETRNDFLDLAKALIENRTNYIINWTKERN
jgi:hypothetical protein